MKIEHFKVEGPCTIKMMNELGNEGWELVFQRADNFHSLVTYFKREVDFILPDEPEPVKVPEPEPVKLVSMEEMLTPSKESVKKAIETKHKLFDKPKHKKKK